MAMKKLHTILLSSAGVLLVIGAILFTLDVRYSEYIFAVGAVSAILQAFLYAIQNKTTNHRLARLQRLYFIATLFLGVAAWFMFVNSNSWVPMVLIYVVISLFLSFRIKK